MDKITLDPNAEINDLTKYLATFFLAKHSTGVGMHFLWQGVTPKQEKCWQVLNLGMNHSHHTSSMSNYTHSTRRNLIRDRLFRAWQIIKRLKNSCLLKVRQISAITLLDPFKMMKSLSHSWGERENKKGATWSECAGGRIIIIIKDREKKMIIREWVTFRALCTNGFQGGEVHLLVCRRKIKGGWKERME